jgi:hypothetical protein
MLTAVGIVRAGGAVGRVGVPHYDAVPQAQPMFYRNITIGGGPARRAPTSRNCCPTCSRCGFRRCRSTVPVDVGPPFRGMPVQWDAVTGTIEEKTAFVNAVWPSMRSCCSSPRPVACASSRL